MSKENHLFSRKEDDVVMWDIQTGREVKRFPQNLTTYESIFNILVQGNHLFVGCSKKVNIFNIQTGQLIKKIKAQAVDLVVKDKYVLTGGWSRSDFKVWQLTPTDMFNPQDWEMRNSVYMERDVGERNAVGQLFVKGNYVFSITYGNTHNITMWSLDFDRDGSRLEIFETAAQLIESVFVYGNYLFGGLNNGQLCIWKIPDRYNLSRVPEPFENETLEIAIEDSEIQDQPEQRTTYGNRPRIHTRATNNSPSPRQEQFEEDSDNFSDTLSSEDTLTTVNQSGESDLLCSNDNPFTLESYTSNDNPIEIFMLDSQGKFSKSTCITTDEIKLLLRSNRDTSIPPNIKAIWTTPNDRNRKGIGGKATGKLLVALPPYNNLFTIGSIEKMLKTPSVKRWFALPLYGGKNRRVGNLASIPTISGDHGQIPGSQIYKLYTKQEIRSGVQVKETPTDFPLKNNSRLLQTIIGGDVTEEFVNRIIKDLIGK